jgi:hypothetical protein
MTEPAAPPSDDEIRRWRRRFASEANNRGWALAEQASRTPAEDAEMLDAAHASRHLWAPIGTADNRAYAELLLAQVHALVGHGARALEHARAAHRHLAAPGRSDWEIAFARAVLAHAAHAAGDADLHAREHAAAVAAAAALDGEDRRVFDATFRTIPRP